MTRAGISMISFQSVVELSKRFGGAINREETDIIIANLFAIFSLLILIWVLPVKVLLTTWVGFRICSWILFSIKCGQFIFGLNVIISVYRIVQRIREKVEVEPKIKADAKLRVPLFGSRFLVRDEVQFSTEQQTSNPPPVMRTKSMAAPLMKSYSQADGTFGNGPSPAIRDRSGLAFKSAAMETAVARTSSPVVRSGTPRLPLEDLAVRLPSWTDKLISNISVSPSDQVKITNLESSMSKEVPTLSADGKFEKTEKPSVTILQRKVLSFDESVKELGIGWKMDQLTENLRSWFVRKVLKPLSNDIKEVNDAFSKVGLDHLNPSHPASFASSSMLNSIGMVRNVISFSTNSSPSQTLMDLAQKSRDDPIVQKRLRIERHLAFASLANRRSHVINRIETLAKDRYLTSFHPTTLGLDSDIEILLSLFCTFMDENLPSSDYYDTQSFSGRHFVRMGEKPSSRSDAIQISQLESGVFELIAGDHIYRTNPASPNSLFHVIIFLTEYLHCRREGFLGIGNLNSRAIDLISIL